MRAKDGKGAKDETTQPPGHHGIASRPKDAHCRVRCTSPVRASVVGPVPIAQIQRYASPCGTGRVFSQSCSDGAPRPGVGGPLGAWPAHAGVYLYQHAAWGRFAEQVPVLLGRFWFWMHRYCGAEVNSGTGQQCCGAAGWWMGQTERKCDGDEPDSSFTSTLGPN